MSIFDEVKKRADVNGDGKVNKDDFNAINTSENKQKIGDLKNLADSNKDGKVSLSDAKNLNIGDIAKNAKEIFKK